MSSKSFDISGSLTWEEGLPRLQYDLIENWIDSTCAAEERSQAWAAIARQWLGELGTALGGGYVVIESDHFLGLASERTGTALIPFGERCRAVLLSVLGDAAGFERHGKQVIVGLQSTDEYYRYISAFYPEGEHGGSAGVHVREGFHHIAVCALPATVAQVLAHELMHVALHHLALPPWLDEGLAQMFEHDMTSRSLLQVNTEMAARQKRYWTRHGLDEFWRGEGFQRAGDVQELSYQLAEILIRLLVEDSRPRWFGWVREPQRRFRAFLQSANSADCGEAASQEHLGFGLGELAARFLGPGSWAPSL